MAEKRSHTEEEEEWGAAAGKRPRIEEPVHDYNLLFLEELYLENEAQLLPPGILDPSVKLQEYPLDQRRVTSFLEAASAKRPKEEVECMARVLSAMQYITFRKWYELFVRVCADFRELLEAKPKRVVRS